jgi:hypothetical protein
MVESPSLSFFFSDSNYRVTPADKAAYMKRIQRFARLVALKKSFSFFYGKFNLVCLFTPF